MDKSLLNFGLKVCLLLPTSLQRYDITTVFFLLCCSWPEHSDNPNDVILCQMFGKIHLSYIAFLEIVLFVASTKY